MEPVNNVKLYDDLLNCIFDKPTLKSNDLISCLFVCKLWGRVITEGETKIRNKLKEMIASGDVDFFGPLKWEKYFGNVDKLQLLPRNICAILGSSCPMKLENMTEDKVYTVGQTHLLFLVPEKVADKSLTINSLGELVKNPKAGQKTGYQTISDEIKLQYGNIDFGQSRWVLLTKNVLEDSQGESYVDQISMVERHVGYEVPHHADVITAEFVKFVDTGECIFGTNPWTSTRCQEQVEISHETYQITIGGLDSSGLIVYCDDCGNGLCGAAAAWEL